MSDAGAGTVERVLGWAHILVALLVIPMTGFFGLTLAPLLIAGPIWLAMVGVRLLRGRPGAWTVARRTHLFAGLVAVLMVEYGLYARRAAALSADEGGGLLGALGYLPLILGISLGTLSAVTLFFSWRQGRTGPT